MGKSESRWRRMWRRGGPVPDGGGVCPCASCAADRGEAEAALTAVLEALAAATGARASRPGEGGDFLAAAPDEASWAPAWVASLGRGDLVTLDGVSALRLRVVDIREHEAGMYGPEAARTLLLQDVASGQVFSPLLPVSHGVRHLPAVPDSPAALGGGL